MCICTLIPALNMVTAVVVLTNALVSGFLSSTLQHSNKHSRAFSSMCIIARQQSQPHENKLNQVS